MTERNYLKTEAVFLAEKTPKKEVVVTPPLREDSLTVTENGTYQPPIGRGYTDVNVNVKPIYWVNLSWDDDLGNYVADKTNADIINAKKAGFIPYLSFQINEPEYADFMFSSPILLTGYDETNNLSLFQSMMYIGDIMFTLHSTIVLPVSTNTYWTLSTRNLASTVYVEEATYYPVYLTQEAGNASDAFTSSEGVSSIINNFDERIPFIYINYNDNTREICTRNLEVCNDGTLHIIYYDPEKTALCKLTHLPTDSGNDWTRSIL